MKRHVSYILSALAILLTGYSCKSDIEKVTLRSEGETTLVASESDVVLTQDEASTIVLSLAWDLPDLLSGNQDLPLAGDLGQIWLEASPGNDFQKIQTISVSSYSKAFSAEELNYLASDLGLTVGVSSTIYFRLAFQTGSNIGVSYSNTCAVTVTPYKSVNTTLSVFSSDFSTISAYLYSPEEDGVYSGFMYASSWYNCWVREQNGTTWGAKPVSGNPYGMSNDTSTAWNFWFPGYAGIYYVTMDTPSECWSALYLAAIYVNGTAITFSPSTKTWSGKVTTSSDGQTLNFTADGYLHDQTTGDSAYKDESITFDAADSLLEIGTGVSTITIPLAGEHTVQIHTNDYAQLVVLIDSSEEGGGTTVTIPESLQLYDKEASTLMAQMYKVEDEVFFCNYAAQYTWENFWFYDDGNSSFWGSEPADGGQYNLYSKDEGAWNCWLGDDFSAGDVLTITADFNNMVWSYTSSTQFVIVYSDGTTQLAPMTLSSEGIYQGTFQTKETWENFFIYDGASDKWYGSAPNDGGRYDLYPKEDGAWNCWLGDDFSAGDKVCVTADFNTNTWSYTVL